MNNKINEELSRIKSMMTYGLQTEGKKQYSTVEYSKEGADGKMYGIVREGTKYYIKIGKTKKDNLLKENYDYIGGFVNRKNNEYTSYANALKQFDLKMMSLKEANANGKNIVVESWNPDKNEELTVEATNKMRNEIMRQKQIMGNAKLINEGKGCDCSGKGGDPFCCSVEKEFADNEDNNLSGKENGKGVRYDNKKSKAVNEKADRLAWHKTGGDAQETIVDTYMDKSHGTEVGDDSPFTEPRHTNGKEMENGVVQEHNTAMAYASDNQNSPEPGVGPIGDDQPFDGEKGTQINEDLNPDEYNEEDELGDDFTEDGSPAPFDGEDSDPSLDSSFDDTDVDDVDVDDDIDVEDDDVDYELETGDAEDGDMESRLSSIESTLQTILDKISDLESAEFDDDDDLYDDEDDFDDDVEEDDEEEPMEFELGDDGEDLGDDFGGEEEPIGDEEPTDDEESTEIYESASYRRMKLAEARKRQRLLKEENRLNDFGKHPAYRKVPMQLPPTGEDQNKHGRDWNDESAHSEQPYGEKIGSGKPFDISPEAIKNSIAESVRSFLKKKDNRRGR